jgi:hypothetical protein
MDDREIFNLLGSLNMNTHEALLEELAQHRSGVERGNPIHEGLEQFFQDQMSDFDYDYRDSYKDRSPPLDYFLYCLDSGIYPPPEVLTLLAKAFNTYFFSQGKVSLEEVFFGEVKKRVGNYSARRSREAVYYRFYFFCKSQRKFDDHKGRPKRSLSNLYKDHLSNNNGWIQRSPDYSPRVITEKDIESEEAFLRGYRRWKNEKK